jgi:DNA-binding winged helix-turn-helix (wHTH) protein
MAQSQGHSKVRFGPFEADLRTGELWREGSRIALQDKPFQLLTALLERPGDLVTREQLHKRLWPESVFTDFEHGLNKAVNKLRRALDDAREDSRYVETLPRRGYRLVAPVEAVLSAPPAASAFRLVLDGRSYPLAPGANVIGREPGAALCLDASSVSRRHAEIVVSAAGVSLRDLASKNGTYVGRARIGEPKQLADGDEIVFGTVRVQFRAGGGESTVTASSSAKLR